MNLDSIWTFSYYYWIVLNFLDLLQETSNNQTFSWLGSDLTPARSWAMITNTNFRIPLSLQPHVVDLWYFKQRVLLGPTVKGWNIKDLIRLQYIGKKGCVNIAQLIGCFYAPFLCVKTRSLMLSYTANAWAMKINDSVSVLMKGVRHWRYITK